MGNEADIHSAYFHGQTLIERHHRVDTISLFPATFVDAVMVPRSPGEWLLSCQVNDHIQGTGQVPVTRMFYLKSLLSHFCRALDLVICQAIFSSR